MIHTLTYTKPLKMTDPKVYQAEIRNFFIGSMSECLRFKKEVEKDNYSTEIKCAAPDQ